LLGHHDYAVDPFVLKDPIVVCIIQERKVEVAYVIHAVVKEREIVVVSLTNCAVGGRIAEKSKITIICDIAINQLDILSLHPQHWSSYHSS
jgi:hypothetical protein